MAKRATRRPVNQAHPPWCNKIYGEPNDARHDPHTSIPERVDADHPSDTSITAYLVLHKRPITRDPKAPVAVLEFNDPASGPDPTSFLLTGSQLCRLTEALYRLVKTAERP
jgi:hypothetical protein